MVLIASRGTPAVLPAKALKERGFKGVIYQTHGVANNDFLRVGGKDVDGSIVPVGPVLVASQLPERDVPDYIEVDHAKMSAKVARIPGLGEVPYPVQMEPNLVIEFYSR